VMQDTSHAYNALETHCKVGVTSSTDIVAVRIDCAF